MTHLLGILPRGFRLLGSRQRTRSLLLFALMLLSSCVELLSVGAVLPFLAVLSVPLESIDPQLRRVLLGLFGELDRAALQLSLTLTFIGLVFFSGLVRYLLLFAQARFSYGVANELSVRMFDQLLHRDYGFHCRADASELIAATASKVGLGVFNVLLPLMLLLTSILSTFAITCGLFVMAPMVTVTVVSLTIAAYLVIFSLYRGVVGQMGEELRAKQSVLFRALQEGFAAIREIIIYKRQQIYLTRFAEADFQVKRILSDSLVIGSAPRYLVETLGVSAIAVAAFYVSDADGGLAGSVPLFGLFVFASQRLLPSVQAIYQNAISIRVGLPACREVIELFERSVDSKNQVSNPTTGAEIRADFAGWRALSFHNVAFEYDSQRGPVLSECNLVIKRGEIVGIVGRSGNGKSTLMDLMMALQLPTLGDIRVDETTLDFFNRGGWQNEIAHVPQQVFLLDGTVYENVAFEHAPDRIDHVAVRTACTAVGLDPLISNLPSGYGSRLGERGGFLSGGQRQRLGIARALYRRASFLLLDEATSALDVESERVVLASLAAIERDITIVMITHRAESLAICSRVLEVADRRVAKEYVSYSEYVDSRPATEALSGQTQDRVQ